MSEPLRLLSQPVVDQLAGQIEANIDRYRAGDFADLAQQNGWSIESRLASWDPAIVGQLDPSGTPEAEVRNSLIVWKGLAGMTPALAREERLWSRLCHIECLEFARARWLNGSDKDANLVRIHFFASGTTGCRDDNAIGRLWWNAHVASLACPDDVEEGLRRLLKRANYRMQIIERANTGFREPLVRGIVRMLAAEPWLDLDDQAIVDFMIDVNKRSGSIVFEALDDDAVDKHLTRCLEFTKARKPRLQTAAA
jgi:cytidylate kinase